MMWMHLLLSDDRCYGGSFGCVGLTYYAPASRPRNYCLALFVAMFGRVVRLLYRYFSILG
jgi:hypothetical protein